MPPDPPRVEAPLGLRQMYPPVTLKYPLVQKLIETPASVTQTNKEVVVPKIIEYSVINRTRKGRLWAISQFYGTMKIMQQTDRQRKWI